MTIPTPPTPDQVNTAVNSAATQAATDIATGVPLSDLAVSLIRTGTPYLVGAVVGWLAGYGLNIPDTYDALIVAGSTFGVGYGYYVIVRALEQKWPKLGRLLGVPAKPTYS